MKKLVSIARALKEKNRVAGRLKQMCAQIERENSREVRIPRGIDVPEMYALAKETRKRLIETKRVIAEANRPIVGKIIELDEIKSEIAFLNALDVKEGRFVSVNYGTRIETEITAIIRKAQVLEEIAELQSRADALQDELDDFNATTKVEIEID